MTVCFSVLPSQFLMGLFSKIPQNSVYTFLLKNEQIDVTFVKGRQTIKICTKQSHNIVYRRDIPFKCMVSFFNPLQKKIYFAIPLPNSLIYSSNMICPSPTRFYFSSYHDLFHDGPQCILMEYT